jgi:anthranilate/para-aminobenzoate synthase component I
MEVIAELEPDQRGVYAARWARVGGNLDMAITARTVAAARGRM